MTVFKKDNIQEEVLNLHDLLVDEKADELSKYLSLSIENLGDDTKITVTTVEATPIMYSTTLSGVSISNLQSLVDGDMDSINYLN
ncbi:MAG: type I secretion C-terminal target domain-containing protein [Methylococcaceae bacterium]|nr:type I secretion C-terminal target domain-containing protein [Methylococcaceae bacterium]